MNRRRQLVLLIAFEVLVQGAAVAAGRLWVGLSWGQVIVSGLFLMLALVFYAVVALRYERGGSASSRASR